MSIDVLDQLQRYGDFVRHEVAALDDGGVLRLEPPTPPSRRRSRRLLAVAAVAVIAGGLAGAVALAPDDVRTTTVAARALPGDPPKLRARMGELTELVVSGPRAATAEEAADVVDELDGEHKEIDKDSVRIVQEGDGWVAVEFDVSVEPPLGQLGDVLHCRGIAKAESGGLRFRKGYGCWDPAVVRPPVEGERDRVSYGCNPRFDLLSTGLFGVKDFQTEIELAPDAVAVVLELEGGEALLARPADGLVTYMGKVAERVQIYDADGDVRIIPTAACR